MSPAREPNQERSVKYRKQRISNYRKILEAMIEHLVGQIRSGAEVSA